MWPSASTTLYARDIGSPSEGNRTAAYYPSRDQGQARPGQGAPSGTRLYDGARVRSPWGGAMVCTVPLADAELDGHELAALEFLELALRAGQRAS